MSNAAITISYTLNPPSGTSTVEGLSVSQAHEYPVNVSAAVDGQKAYYSALQKAIAQAREEVGDELTRWRDAVGKGELNKEPKKVLTEEEEEEEEEEEDV